MPATGTQKQVPPPVGGLNARDAITSMPPEDALVLDNIWPETTYGRIRRGSASWATGIATNVPVPASRYMRFVGLPVRDVWYSISEFEVATSAGGADIMGSASLTCAYANVNNIKDNNTSTEWVATMGAGWTDSGQIFIDFGAPVSPYEVRISSINGTDYWRTVQVFSIHVSDDPAFATYTVVGMFTTPSWTQNETRTFVLSDNYPQTLAAAQAWRVTITANGGDPETSLSEVIYAATAAGAQEATGGQAFLSRMFGSGPATSWIAANTVDGITNNESLAWLANSAPYFVGYLFPTPQAIAEVRIAPRLNNMAEAPVDGAVEWSNDLITWTSVATYTGLSGWANNTYQTVSVP